MKNTILKKGYHIVVMLLLVCLRGWGQQGSSNIEFVENKGQWDPRVKYMGEISIGNLYLERTGFTTLLYHPDDLGRLTSGRHGMPGPGLGKEGVGGKAATEGTAAGKAGMGQRGGPNDILRSHAYRVQ